ncbi:glycoside hydrolase family 16 protein [Russula dissimulans]|nr:glycoside hydrolase family 16 protein [Russula dissimulans]
MLTILLFPLTAAVTVVNPTNSSESKSNARPRILLPPQNIADLRRDTNTNTQNNVTSNTTSGAQKNIYIIEDIYNSTNFFDGFNFFTGDDPTHYVNQTTAFQNNLAYVASNGTIIMKGDDTSTLQVGQYRESVRVSSKAVYNTGLFILDLNRAPWGCGVWPAFWTLGNGVWPATGEIDVLEGVHDNQHNQVTWHTSAGCELTPPVNGSYTGTVVQSNGQPYLDCEGSGTLPGCGVIEWSRASYGPYFDSQGGGVFAMMWAEDAISVWSFYRVAIPPDITEGIPQPDTWPAPTATLEAAGCDIPNYFQNHSIIFDITFCGDWAGNSYATSGCPGTCSDRLTDPSNFVNASWSINSLKVYRLQGVIGAVNAGVVPPVKRLHLPALLGLAAVIAVFLAVQ